MICKKKNNNKKIEKKKKLALSAPIITIINHNFQIECTESIQDLPISDPNTNKYLNPAEFNFINQP